MKKAPALVIMAAGMGSRFGGLKQIAPVDEYGNIIVDFSIYDAKKAGFEKVIFIIKEENAQIFKEVIGDRVSKFIDVEYVFQDINNIPEEFEVPEGRVKPWGTGHAILSCIDTVDRPFAIVNADDFYGREAFELMYDFLMNTDDGDKYNYAMIGYMIENTLTENGYVSRGVCRTDENDYLTNIVECVHIERADGRIINTDDDGTVTEIPEGTTISMNLWGLRPSIFAELKSRFTEFLKNEAVLNPMKSEFYIPKVMGELIDEKKADIKVLTTKERWFGVTYAEDKPELMKAIRALKDEGRYPEKVWED
ncbi:MAG: nucleotidyltransferase [Lachnospiraceae bacterium]|nr:nucleotidyltransferase [Lachnospiraceae bacterium]